MTAHIDIGTAEHSEAETLLELQAAAPADVMHGLGMSHTRIGGGIVTTMSRDVTSYWNKALGFGVTEPVTEEILAQVIEFFRDQGAPTAVIQIAPALLPRNWSNLRERFNLREDTPWVKLTAPVDEVVARTGETTSSLSCGPVEPTDAQEWGEVMMRAFGMPEPLYSEMVGSAATAYDHWHPHALWLGNEIVGAATLATHNGVGQFMACAVLPHARQMGGQTALIGARARAAQAAGCSWLVAETAVEQPGEHNPSLHNMLRRGFKVQYERSNWIWAP